MLKNSIKNALLFCEHVDGPYVRIFVLLMLNVTVIQ